MKILGQIIAVMIVVLLLGGAGYGIYLGAAFAQSLAASLDPQVAAVTAIGGGVALVAAWIVAHSVRAAGRAGKALAVREEKAATYQLFVDFWANAVRAAPTAARAGAIERADKQQTLERLLALYGDAAVIAAHAELRALERERDARHPSARERLGEALLAIRRDLGTDRRGDRAQDLERLLLEPDAAVAASSERREAMSPLFAPRS